MACVHWVGTENVYQYQSGGYLQGRPSFRGLGGIVHFKSAFMCSATYQELSQHTDTDGGYPSNQYNLGADYGRSANGYVRHGLSFGSSIELPCRTSSAYVFVNAQSSAPFNITLGQDLNGDAQYNDRPAFATDLTRASVVKTKLWNVRYGYRCGGTDDRFPVQLRERTRSLVVRLSWGWGQLVQLRT